MSAEKTEQKKKKLLYLVRMFFEQTNADHGLSMPQIIEELEEIGISAERKAIYRDIDVLQEFGFDIQTLPRRPVEYALVKRTFTQNELTLLVDAVQESRFLTQKMSNVLTRSLSTLAPQCERAALRKRVHVAGRIKSQNESVYHNVDVIQEALRTKRKISFRYFKYDASKTRQLQRKGELYLETPVYLIYNDGFYYLVTYNDKYAELTHYRVDRMMSLCVSDEKATKNEVIANFNAEDYHNHAFSMYKGPVHSVVFFVHESAMSGVLDRFGMDITISEEFVVSDSVQKSKKKTEQRPKHDFDLAPGNWAKVRTTVMQSPAFFGWLAQFGSNVIIDKPTSLAQAYRDYLACILKTYER